MENQLCKPCDYRRAFRFNHLSRWVSLGNWFSFTQKFTFCNPLIVWKRSETVKPSSYLQEWRFRPWCEYWPIWFLYKMKWYYKCGGDKIEQPW